MKSFVFAVILLVSGLSFAACIGSDAVQTCTDASGNRYNVQRYGSTTQMQGTSPSTGSIWSQTRQTYGGTRISTERRLMEPLGMARPGSLEAQLSTVARAVVGIPITKRVSMEFAIEASAVSTTKECFSEKRQ